MTQTLHHGWSPGHPGNEKCCVSKIILNEYSVLNYLGVPMVVPRNI
jgi:hypothetical protein